MATENWTLPLIENERYAFVEPTPDGIDYIAENLRPADREELHATVGHRRYAETLRLSVLASDSVVMGVTAWGEPGALVGVGTTSLLYNTGSPWMMATPVAGKYRRAFIEAGRAYTCAMLSAYERLENHVDARNTASVVWLQQLGFELEEPKPFGRLGLPFHRFSITRSEHVR